MSGLLLITHTLKCAVCEQHQRKSLYSNTQLRRNLSKRVCKECQKYSKFICHTNNLAQRMAVFECVVCGKSLKTTKSFDIIRLSTPQRKRSVCSDSCLNIYDKAIEYVNKLHGLKDQSAARDIVIQTWFQRRVKEHEKDIRVQKRNAERNAAIKSRKLDSQSSKSSCTAG